MTIDPDSLADPLPGAFDRAFDAAEHRVTLLREARGHLALARQTSDRSRGCAAGGGAPVGATEPPSPPAYRVIYQEHGETRDLGRLVGVPAHASALDPFVSALLGDGRGGLLALVDELTEETVARRAVVRGRGYSAPPPRPTRHRPRRPPARSLPSA